VRADQLPSDTNAEQALLGLIMQDARLLDQEELTEALFHDPVLRQAFGILSRLHVDGQPISSILASDAFRNADLGSGNTLARDLLDVSFGATARIVVPHLRAYARRRETWRLGDVLQRIAAAPNEGDREALETVIDKLTALLVDQPLASNIVRAREYLPEYLADLELHGTRQGLPMGFTDLDRMLGGVQPGELLVVAGRPSIGKSAFAHQVIGTVAGAGKHVLLVTPEMGRRQVLCRMLCQIGHIDSDDLLRAPTLSEKTWTQLLLAEPRLPDFAIYDAACTSAEVRAVSRQVHARRPLDLLVVDHVGWLSDQTRSGESYAVTVGRKTKALKAIGRTLGCGVVVLSQLNRQSEQGETMRRPGLADLRDSGEIEQDADGVILLHRETREAREAEAIVAKARNGPTGLCKLVWEPHTTRFLARAFPRDAEEGQT